jgi:hypothetical protein
MNPDLDVSVHAQWIWKSPAKDKYEQILRDHAQAMLLVAAYASTGRVRQLVKSELSKQSNG